MNTVYITSKYGDCAERKIAECEYGDDAELLFRSYEKAGYACRVMFHGALSEEETLKCEAKT